MAVKKCNEQPNLQRFESKAHIIDFMIADQHQGAHSRMNNNSVQQPAIAFS
jgi:hypothetical protein